MKKIKYIKKTFLLPASLLFVILVIATLIRLYKIDTPLADFHSWRQADTAAVARNFVQGDFNLLSPRYDDLSNIQSGVDNPNGYRMVEFPIYNAEMALVYKALPYRPIEQYGRILTILATLVTIAIIFYLLLKESGLLAASFGSLIYAIFPFFVYFTRVVLPEPTALMFVFISIVTLYQFNQKDKPSWSSWLLAFISMISFAVALLIKPTTIFFGISIFYLFIKKYDWNVLKKPLLYLFGILSLAPLVWWRLYIRQFPEGIPSSEWLLTHVNTYQGLQNIFLRPAFFRWIFFQRINNIILGGYLTVYFIIGVLKRSKNYLLHSILVSSLAYLFVFEGGNVQHEYYQTLILPALAIFSGIGIAHFLKQDKQFLWAIITYPVVIGLATFAFFMSYYQVKDYYNVSYDLVNTAKIVSDLTGPNDHIVTDTEGDTTLLYLLNRKGAPAVFVDLPELKNKGYTYFVTLNKPVIDSLIQKHEYPLIFESDKFALFKL